MARKFTVASQGTVLGLGISGPITTPVVLDPKNVLKMVKKGMVIYEHNPYNTAEKVKMTVYNINTNKFDMAAGLKAKSDNEAAIQKAQGMVIGVAHREAAEKENNNKKNNKDSKITKPDNFEKN